MFILHMQDQFYLKRFGTEELINSQHVFKSCFQQNISTFILVMLRCGWRSERGDGAKKYKLKRNHSWIVLDFSAASDIKSLLIAQWKKANEYGYKMAKVWTIVVRMTIANKRGQYKYKYAN